MHAAVLQDALALGRRKQLNRLHTIKVEHSAQFTSPRAGGTASVMVRSCLIMRFDPATKGQALNEIETLNTGLLTCLRYRTASSRIFLM